MKFPNSATTPDVKKLGFLDLPAEIRLQIYPKLLVGQKKRRNWKKGADSVLYPYWESVDWDTAIDIASARSGVDPSTLFHQPEVDKHFKDEALSTQILSTCRLIHREAVPILYNQNQFDFSSDLIDSPSGRSTSRNIRAAIRDLMARREEDWCDSLMPRQVEGFKLAAFVCKIGPHNSAALRRLKLWSPDTDQATIDVRLAMQTCEHHLPGLEVFELHVFDKDIAWDESPEYCHPDYSSPFWANGPFEPMYRALVALVNQVHWLKEFKYDSQYGQWRFEEPNAMSKIWQLERQVVERAERRATKDQRRKKYEREHSERAEQSMAI